MADVPVPGYPQFWTDKRSSLEADHKLLVAKYPEAEVNLKQLFKILCDIQDVAGYAPASVGENVEWTAEDNRASYSKALTADPLQCPV
jgi:hypothetical protein